MGLRKKPRIKMVVPVRVWGTDSAGKPFNILAYTLNVSSSGARIGGVRIPLAVGEALTIQYKQQRALFKVVWIGRPGDQTREQVGVSLLEPERQIWAEIHEPPGFRDDFVGERRGAVPSPQAPAGAPQSEAAAPAVVEEVAEQVPTAADEGKEIPTPGEQGEAVAQEALPVLTGAESPRDPDEIIRNCSRGLLRIERVVKQTPPGIEALQEFRDAIAKIRQTVWALQQWHEMKDESTRAFPLLAYLNMERLRFVVQAVQDLADDIATKGVEVDPAMLEKFFASVEQLRSRSATPGTEPVGFSMEVVAAAPGATDSAALLRAIQAAAVEIQRSGMTTAPALEYLARELQRILGADGVTVAQAVDGEMLCAGSSGNAPETGMVLESETGLAGDAMKTGRLVYCRDTQADARVDAELCKAARIGSVAILPVQASGGASVGMLQVSSARSDAFGTAQLEGLKAAGDLLRAILGGAGAN